jgi:molecular chaperone DnaK (HSP70)
VRQYDPNQAVAKGAALFGHKCELEDELRVHIANRTGRSKEEVDVATTERSVVEAAQKAVAHAHGYGLPGVKAILEKDVTNVTSKSFGVIVVEPEEQREAVANLILADERVPATVTQRFGTVEDGQTAVDIRCMEGELAEAHVEPGVCKQLGNAVLRFERPLPAGSPVEITFDLGADGRLKLHGKDLTTGRTVESEFKTDAILSREEVEAAKRRNLGIKVA